jgi:hypothetical protein
MQSPSKSNDGVIDALHFVRAMRGGAQSKLVLGSNRQLYVVKFQNNPQHRRILINEMVGAKLARLLGLPVPETRPIAVSDALIRSDARFALEYPHGTVPCQAGLQFGSRYVVAPSAGQAFDLAPKMLLGRMDNAESFLGALVFDKWTANIDWRQVVVWKRFGDDLYHVTLVDQGGCFGGGRWTFFDISTLGFSPSTSVYGMVHGWDSFEPWLTRLESLPEQDIWTCTSGVPTEWIRAEDDFDWLTEKLWKRRGRVRQLIKALRHTVFSPFPNWRTSVFGMGPRMLRCN